MPRQSQQSIRRKGSVLIAVLGLIALLSALLISFLGEAMERIKFNGLLDNGTDLRERAYSALDASLASISQIGEIDNKLRSRAQGWGEPLKYAGFDLFDDCEITVTCDDEAAKLPLSIMNEKQIVALLEEMEVSASDADKLAQSILDWMDGNDEARLDSLDGEDYEKVTNACKPTNAVPRSWDEFSKIDDPSFTLFDAEGKPTAIFEQFKNAVSLYSDASVNINDASPLVLATLAELGGFEEDDIINELVGDDDIRGTLDDKIYESTSELGAKDAQLADFTTQLIRLRVVASRGDAHFSLDVLLKYKGTSSTTATSGVQTKLSDGYEDFPEKPETSLSYPFTILQLTETRTAP